jgi:transcriptional regulator with XRE-family HTH domain
MTMIMIDKIVSSIGDKISHLRKQKNLSLSRLAKKAGISPTCVHKLERNEMTPTITVLMRIADALEVKVGYFVHEESDEFEYVDNVEYVAKKSAKKIQKHKDGAIVQYAAFRLRGANLYSQVVRFPKAGAKSGTEAHTHLGEHFIFCLDGEVLQEVDGKVYHLEKGDSIHYFCTRPHRWEITGKKGATMMFIATPPPTGEFTEFWK